VKNIRLNVTLPANINEQINEISKELNQKKSHIIASALEMYLDYIDIQIAKKRENEEGSIDMETFFKDLEIDVQDRV